MSNRSRIDWSQQQDRLLKQLKQNKNICNWRTIAQEINKISKYQRNTKQCRERYRSNVKFNATNWKFRGMEKERENTDEVSSGILIKSHEERHCSYALFKKWTLAEQKLLLQLYQKHNSKWSLYTEHFQNKSQNNIKNRFNNILKRNLTKINSFIANKTNKKFKNHKIKVQEISCLLQLSKKIENLLQGYNNGHVNVKQFQSLSKSQLVKQTNQADILFQVDFYNNDILKVKDKLILGCLQDLFVCQEYVIDFLEALTQIGNIIRGVGIRRAKNKRFWNLNSKKLQYIFKSKRITDQDSSSNRQAQEKYNQKVENILLASSPQQNSPQKCGVQTNPCVKMTVLQNKQVDTMNQVLNRMGSPDILDFGIIENENIQKISFGKNQPLQCHDRSSKWADMFNFMLFDL